MTTGSRSGVEIDPSKYDILLVGPRISRLKPFFTQRSYRADAIQGGQEGLEALQSKLYHLVVLELNLEDIEPADFIDYALRTQPNAAYMLMDDPAKSGMIVSTFVRGIDVYVPIPPDEDTLFVQVGRHVLAAAARGGGRSEVEQYESELKSARASLETAGAQVRRLREENEALKGELALVRSTLDEAEEKQAEQINSLRNEQKGLRDDVMRLKRELESESAAAAPLRAEIEELREKADMLTIIEAENEDLKNRLTRALQRPAASSAPVGNAAPLLAGMRPATTALSAVAIATSAGAIALGMADEEVSILDDDEGTGIVEDGDGLVLSGDDDGEIILDDEGTLTVTSSAHVAPMVRDVGGADPPSDELILDEDDESSTMVKPGIATAAEMSEDISIASASSADDDDASTLVKVGITSTPLFAAHLGGAALAGDDDDSSTMVKPGISTPPMESDILADALASIEDDAVHADAERTSTGVTSAAASMGIDAFLNDAGGFSDEQTVNFEGRLETRDHPVRAEPPPALTAPVTPSAVYDEATRVAVDGPAATPFSFPHGMEDMISELVDDSTRDIPIPDEIQALGMAVLEQEVASILNESHDDMGLLGDEGEVLAEFSLGSSEGEVTSGPTSSALTDDDEATRNIPLPDSILSAASRGDAAAGAVLEHVGVAASVAGANEEVTRLGNPLESSLSALGRAAVDFGDETAAIAIPTMGPPASAHDDSGFDDQTAATMVPGALVAPAAHGEFDPFDVPSTQATGEGPEPANNEQLGLDDVLTSTVPLPSEDAIAGLASATVMIKLPLAPATMPTKRAPERGLTLGERADDDMRPQIRDERSLRRAASGGGTPAVHADEFEIDFDD